jgi:hypothetical protein
MFEWFCQSIAGLREDYIILRRNFEIIWKQKNK